MDVVDRLTRAAEDGDAALATHLLGAGAEVDVVGTAGRTALDLAVHAGHARIVRVLLAAGANPRQAVGGYRELTPICLAAMYGHTAVMGPSSASAPPPVPRAE
ncbi:ankyrin repeat domain-containing protein [Streptomyces sp. CS081A]|uniref:ankyrin repeat domain-containing protein n=1 Tax=Streptomyces sp. CS081A TaxID=2162709 RepID=UPI001EF53806|nr:ankyrin repeat domain-containing protein [Streptomyces sp. CS081A]